MPGNSLQLSFNCSKNAPLYSNTRTKKRDPLEQHGTEKISTEEAELQHLIVSYLPPIPNSEGYECRGTVAETLAEVLIEDNYRKVSPDEQEFLSKRVTPLERKTYSAGVVGALNFIDQLRSRGDQPGEDFAEILQPLADAYRQLANAGAARELTENKVPTKTEWQVRMPEDRHSEDGWMTNTELGATYLEREHGAEVRTRSVTGWKKRDKK